MGRVCSVVNTYPALLAERKGWRSSIGIFIAILSFVRGDLLAAIFSNDAAVIARAAEYLKGFVLEARLTMIGLAAPCATIFGIAINLVYFVKINREMKNHTVRTP